MRLDHLMHGLTNLNVDLSAHNLFHDSIGEGVLEAVGHEVDGKSVREGQSLPFTVLQECAFGLSSLLLLKIFRE